MIEVRELAKRYGTVEALKGVSFEVPKGQVVGLLGPNGAGKTTAMRIITGYVAPTSGVALVDGEDVFEDPIQAQRKIGYLPEGNPLYLDLRLEESLKYAAELFGVKGRERDAAVAESIRLAGLAGMEHRVLGTLSKGYRQRAGLAQALLHKPPILILDEPTSGLDPNQQEEMRDLIRSLGAERTVILSTHILPEVEAVCDRALIISAGKLVADGTVAEIKAKAEAGNLAVASVRGTPEAARAAFAALDFAEGIETEPGDEPGVVRVLIRVPGTPSAERMERIATAAHAHRLPLSGLESVTATLEKVFAELTTTKSPAPAEPVAAGTETR
jgi:ABC-2 type transport system ATP-binding protein